MPSTQAPESPRRPMRRMQRTCGLSAAIARAACAVPSGLSSSTTTISCGVSGSARPIRSTIGARFWASLKVGSTIVSFGDCMEVAGWPWKRPRL